MSYQTHDLAEWAAVLSLSTGCTASAFVPWLLLVDSTSARDFDPRPLVFRALDTDAGARLVVAVDTGKANTARTKSGERRCRACNRRAALAYKRRKKENAR